MDLNKKVDELVKITTTLKNDIHELKGKDISTILDELEEEKEALKDDIEDLKSNLTQQNEKILSLIKQQNNKLFEIIQANKLAPELVSRRKISEYAKLFPVKSLEKLDELEELINDENVEELIAIVHQLLQPKGIVKNISMIISVPCIMECNVDGQHNKRRLLSSPKFMDLIFRAACGVGYSKKIFLDEFRRGFKMVKNSYNKNLCLHRQKQREKEEQTNMQESDIEDVKLEETEKIYFD